MLAYDKTNLTPNEIQNAVLLSMLITDKTEWTSSDAEIASVDENGIITALKEGACKITVRSGEHEFACDVLVDFQKKADEEFLEYVERIGAYTELPLGTDGSAGPTAQYVTFGFDENFADKFVVPDSFRDEPEPIVTTTYKGCNYLRYNNKWYWGSHIGVGYKLPEVIPKKWWLCDKEKGLMISEECEAVFPCFVANNIFSTSGVFDYVPYIEQIISAIKEITTLCDYETSFIHGYFNGEEFFDYELYYYTSDKSFAYIKPRLGYVHFDVTALYCQNTERQLAQIKEMDLDCGEGGHTKGRKFILSEEEIKACFSNGYKVSLEYFHKDIDIKYILTRTRKKIDGENKLFAVELNEDRSFKEFTYLDGYTLIKQKDYCCYIPAICVKPAP